MDLFKVKLAYFLIVGIFLVFPLSSLIVEGFSWEVFNYLVFSVLAYGLMIIVAASINMGWYEAIEFSFSKSVLYIVFCFSVLLFVFFLYKSTNGFEALGTFRHNYRYGAYSGSGLYTYPLMKVMLSAVCIYIVLRKRLDMFIVISLITMTGAAYFLGLRIMVAPLFITFLMLLFVKSSLKVVLVSGVVLLSLMVLSKYSIYSDQGKGLLEAALNPFTRLNLKGVIIPASSFQFADLLCLMDFKGYLFGCGVEEFKAAYFDGDPELIATSPNFGTYTGVSLPLPVYLFNSGGFLAIPILSMWLLITFFLWIAMWKSRSVLYVSILTSLFLTSIMCVIEDIGVNINFLYTLILFMMGGVVILSSKYGIRLNGSN